MDYRSTIPQIPIFEEIEGFHSVLVEPVTFQYSDVPANRESGVICLLVLVSHSRAYRDALFASWKWTKKKCRSFVKPSISDTAPFCRPKKSMTYFLCMILFTQCSLYRRRACRRSAIYSYLQLTDPYRILWSTYDNCTTAFCIARSESITLMLHSIRHIVIGFIPFLF